MSDPLPARARILRAAAWLAVTIVLAVAVQLVPKPAPVAASKPARPRVCLSKRASFKLPANAFASPPHAALATLKRWPAGTTLTVAFQGGSVADRKEFMDACAVWESVANIHFKQVDSDPSDVRVLIDNSGGSWSYLGQDIKGIPLDQPTTVLGWRDDFGRSLHEIGHLLALEHEDQAYAIPWNVPVVLAYYEGPPNNWTQAEVYEQVINRVSDPILSDNFDRLSIMAYAIPAQFVTDPSFVAPWNQSLSAHDKQRIAEWYPKPPSRSNAPSAATPVPNLLSRP